MNLRYCNLLFPIQYNALTGMILGTNSKLTFYCLTSGCIALKTGASIRVIWL